MFEKMSEILGFAVLEKSTNVRLQTIRKEDMEIKKKFFYFILLYNTVLVLPYINMNFWGEKKLIDLGAWYHLHY